MKMLLRHVTLAVAIAALTGVAYAIPQLRISDGVTIITIADSSANDSNPTPGVVTWTGSIGVWTINLGTGTTKPELGFKDLPWMDLDFDATSSSAGTLTVMFTETDFNTTYNGVPAGYARLRINGNTTGSVMYDVYGSAFGPTRNTAFDTTRRLGSIGPLSGAFNASYFGQAVVSGDYSLTEVLTITHAGAGATSASAELRVPEGGTSILLLSVGLTGLGLLGRFPRRVRPGSRLL